MLTLNNKTHYQGLVFLATQILAAYDQRELHIRLGKCLGFAIALYPQNYGILELNRYQEFVKQLAEQRELQIVKRQYASDRF